MTELSVICYPEPHSTNNKQTDGGHSIPISYRVYT